MKILWLSWKDKQHPYAGGAEVVLHELCKRLIAEGHEVTILTARYTGAKKYDHLDGAKVVRIGTNSYTHSFLALAYYLRHFRNQFDVIVDVVNTAPYLASLFRGNAKHLLFYHQLARKIWFYETKRPLSWLGYYLLEPGATFLLSHFGNGKIITISNSSKHDLIRHGFKSDRIAVISQGIELQPVKNLDKIKKYSQPTLLSLGTIRPMKGTAEQIKAFELAKPKIKNLKLKVAGGAVGEYGQKVLNMIENSPYAKDIEYLGKVNQKQKIELMRRSHLILVSSVKEGWGLIVTEAASQGTPAVVYDVDGLRDSVQHQVTGLISRANTPGAMATQIIRALQDSKLYTKLRQEAWTWSHQITFDKSYKDFMASIE